MTVMKGVAGRGGGGGCRKKMQHQQHEKDHHQHQHHHQGHHHGHHHHHHQNLNPPQDSSHEYSVSGTSSSEVVLSAPDSEELAQEHRRSLSAPEKACGPGPWDFSPRASLNQALKESLHHWRWKKKRKSLEDKKNNKKQILHGRRAALEQDVAQLQTQLQNEKTLRMGLKRALEEASDDPLMTIMPQPSDIAPDLAHQSRELITEIVALQNEVSHLEQHVLSLYRKVLDQRLSNSHQYYTKNSTTVDRQQQLLRRSSEAQEELLLPPTSTIVSVQSSYRVSRFKVEQRSQQKTQQQQQQHRQCTHGSSSSDIPAAVSTQGFNKRPHSAIGAAAAAGQSHHVKTSSRYGSFFFTGSFHCIGEEPDATVQPHPVLSVSSPARQSLQSQVSPKLSRMKNPKPAARSSTSHGKADTTQLLPVVTPPKKISSGQPDVGLDKISSGQLDVGLDPSSRRTTTANELSEELLCCMAAIYCKLADPPLPESSELSNSFSSPSCSTSSSSTTTTTIHESLSREFCNNNTNSSNESWSARWRTATNLNTSSSCDIMDVGSCIFPNQPYSVNDMGREDFVGPYGSMVEVSWICVDKERLAYAARALKNFRLMVEQLEKVDPGKMTQDEKLAFWINVYNALMMHAYLAYGIPRNQLKRLSLLQKAAYKVGHYSISAQMIEHSILGFHSNRPAQWLQALLNPGTKFKSGDERWAYALQTPEPSVCFALCCGGCSDPAVRVYTAKNVRFELEVAKREFLQASVGICGDSRVLLPKILDWYSRELAINLATLLEWVCENVPRKLEARIRQCIELKLHKSSAHCIQWLPYSFVFRYIFVHDLACRYSLSIKDTVS